MGRKRSMGGLALFGLVFGLGLAAGLHMDGADAAPAEGARVYELRTYTTNEGKLDALHDRFSNHTNRLFIKHGMTLVGYWTLADGDGKDNTLVYLIAHEDRDAAKASWRAFGSDKVWREAYAKSKKDGALVKKVISLFLVPTDYSPLR